MHICDIKVKFTIGPEALQAYSLCLIKQMQMKQHRMCAFFIQSDLFLAEIQIEF